MFKVLIQNYTTCEGCMVIDAAGTKYKLNSKRVLVQLQTVCVVHVYKLQWSCAAQHTLNWRVGLHVQLVQCWPYKELDHQQNRQEVCLTASADTGYSLVTVS